MISNLPQRIQYHKPTTAKTLRAFASSRVRLLERRLGDWDNKMLPGAGCRLQPIDCRHTSLARQSVSKHPRASLFNDELSVFCNLELDLHGKLIVLAMAVQLSEFSVNLCQPVT